MKAYIFLLCVVAVTVAASSHQSCFRQPDTFETILNGELREGAGEVIESIHTCLGTTRFESTTCTRGCLATFETYIEACSTQPTKSAKRTCIAPYAEGFCTCDLNCISSA